MISIEGFIETIIDDNILVINDKKPSSDYILETFIKNPKLNAIKYTTKSKRIVINPDNNNYLECPKIYTDIITNIRCNDDAIVLIDKKPINCNISKLTIPVVNMKYTTSRLEIVSEHNILFDSYVLSDTLREFFRKKRVTNCENMIFHTGSVHSLMSYYFKPMNLWRFFHK